MNGTEAFEKLTKEQVIDLIIWQMFQKGIKQDELTEAIKVKEKEIIKAVNDKLASQGQKYERMYTCDCHSGGGGHD